MEPTKPQYDFLLFSFLFFICLSNAMAQNEDETPLPYLGNLEVRSSRQIIASNWSIGGETLDRDLTVFDHWKEYLSPLGAKKMRLQAGWAKCEKQKGVYDFEWLDEIIDYLVSNDIEPWLQTSYGNPIYESGGGIHLNAGFPRSKEALDAWDKWVYALANRYRGKVNIWEVWNEPEKNSVEDYAGLYVRTAEIIRKEIPSATLYALSMAEIKKTDYLESFLAILTRENKLRLVDDITVHGYTYRPEDTYPHYQKLYEVIARYSDRIRLNQGELGCPSTNIPYYALKNYDWTEVSQSKWLLRKLLGDLGHDIPSLYFTIADIIYTHDGVRPLDENTRNSKGLLEANFKREIVRKKQAYHAYQHVTAIFDHTFERIPNYSYKTDIDSSLAVFGYRKKYFDQQLVAIWFDAYVPDSSIKKVPANFQFNNGIFENPVYLDVRTGKVYNIPSDQWEKNGTHYIFKDIPVYDSPILIVDKGLIKLKNN
ncbi:hypothetical protein FNH22_08940 [Fulvivirga sp. M361]|uniref:beta-galactosidase n=1 Tax=Fulvivirga sp. M361 TaxID=2594266 RepID=UPI00117B6166|nr:beta-galactosidase [Fulvivirga sp. M361]TRX60163.1 hypothetical protein FNH22_08940 [Fulvivirga sp. M361]